MPWNELEFHLAEGFLFARTVSWSALGVATYGSWYGLGWVQNPAPGSSEDESNVIWDAVQGGKVGNMRIGLEGIVEGELLENSIVNRSIVRGGLPTEMTAGSQVKAQSIKKPQWYQVFLAKPSKELWTNRAVLTTVPCWEVMGFYKGRFVQKTKSPLDRTKPGTLPFRFEAAVAMDSIAGVAPWFHKDGNVTGFSVNCSGNDPNVGGNVDAAFIA